MDLTLKANEFIQKAGFKTDILRQNNFPVLSTTDLAGKLKVLPERLSTTVTLTPGKPRIGKNNLTFYSPMMVMTSEASTNDLALFTSKYPDIGFIGLKVDFAPISKNKMHLVEFHITLNDPQKAYKFRITQYPVGTAQDVTISNQQVLYTIVPAVNEDFLTYGVQVMQQNTPSDEAGWIFRSVKITSVS